MKKYEYWHELPKGTIVSLKSDFNTKYEVLTGPLKSGYHVISIATGSIYNERRGKLEITINTVITLPYVTKTPLYKAIYGTCDE